MIKNETSDYHDTPEDEHHEHQRNENPLDVTNTTHVYTDRRPQER